MSPPMPLQHVQQQPSEQNGIFSPPFNLQSSSIPAHSSRSSSSSSSLSNDDWLAQYIAEERQLQTELLLQQEPEQKTEQPPEQKVQQEQEEQQAQQHSQLQQQQQRNIGSQQLHLFQHTGGLSFHNRQLDQTSTFSRLSLRSRQARQSPQPPHAPQQQLRHSQNQDFDSNNNSSNDNPSDVHLKSVVIILDPHTASSSSRAPNSSSPTATAASTTGNTNTNTNDVNSHNVLHRHPPLRIKLWRVFCTLLEQVFGCFDKAPRLTILTIDDRQDGMPHVTVLCDSVCIHDARALRLARTRLCVSLVSAPVLHRSDLDQYAHALLELVKREHHSALVHILTAPAVANVLNQAKERDRALSDVSVWIPSSMNINILLHSLKQIIIPAFVTPLQLRLPNRDLNELCVYPRFILPPPAKQANYGPENTSVPLNLTATRVVARPSITEDHVFGVPHIVKCMSKPSSPQRQAYESLLAELIVRDASLLSYCLRSPTQLIHSNGHCLQWYVLFAATVPQTHLTATHGNRYIGYLRPIAIHGAFFSPFVELDLNCRTVSSTSSQNSRGSNPGYNSNTANVNLGTSMDGIEIWTTVNLQDVVRQYAHLSSAGSHSDLSNEEDDTDVVSGSRIPHLDDYVQIVNERRVRFNA